jgi:hypothetical protein
MTKQNKNTSEISIPDTKIIDKIYIIRNQKVMLDRDLAELYGVETRILNQAVKRNLKRFPEDFMFQLTSEEQTNLISQNVISSWGGTRKPALVFTEQGVAMLSSVLNSEKAIEVNIQIIRIFTRIREALLTHKDILLQLEKLERQSSKHNTEIQYIFDVLKKLIEKPKEKRVMIGYKRKNA